MHGAGGGPPKGNRNALKHGRYTDESISFRRSLSSLMRQARELAETV